MTARVVVLLATLSGMPWIREQIGGILAQEGVEVRLVVSDDGSTDGTAEYLAELVASDSRVTLLPRRTPGGASAQNFLYLIETAEVHERELVAFADQDDIWAPDKLAAQARHLTAGAFDGVSGSVTALFPDGRTQLVRKDYPQRRFDYVCESPGPGSTFLLTPRAFRLVRETIKQLDAGAVGFHDWLIYAVVRGHGWTWDIEGTPRVLYRQHGANQMGANSGLRAKVERLRSLRSGWYRAQFALMAQVARSVARDPETADSLTQIGAEWQGTESESRADRVRSSMRLARRATTLRRNRRDAIVLGTGLMLGLW